jgi:hypothetical protein
MLSTTRDRIAGECSLDELGESEIQHFDLVIAADHDVGRLRIAMHNTGGMGSGERVGDLYRVLPGVNLHA